MARGLLDWARALDADSSTEATRTLVEQLLVRARG
jgi:hypothetical protein